MFFRPSLILVLALFFALAGIWLDGAREEIAIHRALAEHPQLNQAPMLRCSDGFYWLYFARESLDQRKPVIRWTTMDNAPAGRANVGWSSFNAWYLIVLGEVWSWGSGLSLRDALLPASVWANPIVYFGFILLWLIAGWKRKRFGAAVMSILVLATIPRLYADFGAASPDHHGWHDIIVVVMLVCLAQALRTGKAWQWGFTGFIGAFAVWNGATFQAFVLSAGCTGAVLGTVLTRLEQRRTEGGVDEKVQISFSDPSGWRIFGIIAAVFCLFFYLFEYGFHPLEMRLEVNHPIFSAGFLVGGEFLCRLQRLILKQNSSSRKRDVAVLAGSFLVLALIGIALFAGPVSWHIMRQPFFKRLHEEISEFQPILSHGVIEAVAMLGGSISLSIVGLTVALRSNVAPASRAGLFACIVPGLVSVALSIQHLRWSAIAGASAAALVAVLFAAEERREREPGQQGTRPIITPRLKLACVLFPVLFASIWCVRFSTGSDIRNAVIDQVATADLAQYLKQTSVAATKPPVVLFLDQKVRQAWIGYQAGIQSIGSMYWENPALIEESEFWSTYDDATAQRIAREHHVTHIVTIQSAESVIAYHYLWQGNRDVPEIRHTLGYRLAAPTPNPPGWLELLLPGGTAAMQMRGIRVYRVR